MHPSIISSRQVLCSFLALALATTSAFPTSKDEFDNVAEEDFDIDASDLASISETISPEGPSHDKIDVDKLDFSFCPVIAQKSEEECRGSLMVCWNQNKLDQDCDNGRGYCCFNGCGTECRYDDTVEVPEDEFPVGPEEPTDGYEPPVEAYETPCVVEYEIKEVMVTKEMCKDELIEECDTEIHEDCSEEVSVVRSEGVLV